MRPIHLFRSPSPRRLLVALAVSVLTLATACAGAGSDRGADPNSIEYVQGTDSLAYLPLYVAHSMGYWEEEGLHVNRAPNGGNTSGTAQAVESRQSDIGAVGSTGLYSLVAQGRDVVGIGPITQESLLEITLRNDVMTRLEGSGVTNTSDIAERVRALKGLRLGTLPEGSLTRVQLAATFREYGLDPDRDVELISIGEESAIVPALRQGRIDGMAFSPPATQLPIVEGFGSLFISYPRGDVPITKQSYYIDLMSSKQLLNERPDVLKRFLSGLQRAYDLIQRDPDTAKDAARKSFPELDSALFDSAYEAVLPAFQRGMQPTREGFERTAAFWSAGLKDPQSLGFSDVYPTALFGEQAK